ncbi:unnamed protein product [Arctogadus glacialis]
MIRGRRPRALHDQREAAAHRSPGLWAGTFYSPALQTRTGSSAPRAHIAEGSHHRGLTEGSHRRGLTSQRAHITEGSHHRGLTSQRAHILTSQRAHITEGSHHIAEGSQRAHIGLTSQRAHIAEGSHAMFQDIPLVRKLIQHGWKRSPAAMLISHMQAAVAPLGIPSDSPPPAVTCCDEDLQLHEAFMRPTEASRKHQGVREASPPDTVAVGSRAELRTTRTEVGSQPGGTASLGQTELLDPELLDPELLDPELLDPELLDPELLDPELLDPELLDPELLDPELLDPELLDPELLDPELLDPELLDPELLDPELLDPELGQTV